MDSFPKPMALSEEIREDPPETEKLAPFIKRYEIARHFLPHGSLQPYPKITELLNNPEVTAEQVTSMIRDTMNISLPEAPPRVWKFINDPEMRTEFEEVIYRAKIVPASSTSTREDSYVILLDAPEIDNTCRIRQKFSPDRFIRVSIHQRLLRYNPLSIPRKFTLCDREYEFMCPRDDYCYYFATRSHKGEFETMTPLDIIFWHIPREPNQEMLVHKFASRIDLGFSSILGIVDVGEVVMIDDVVNEKGVVMTDGCAPVGSKIMEKLRDKLKLPSSQIPSAVQARIGAAKGVWYLDPTLPPDTIHIRASQMKYNEPAVQDLEVIYFSKPQGPARLNRQLILLLESLGIEALIFLTMQDEMISNLKNKIFAKDPFVTASWVEDKLQRLVETEEDDESLYRNIYAMILSGFDRNTFYLYLLLSELFIRLVQGLRKKAWIELKQSRSILMIADPTGTLEEGECFLQISPYYSDDFSGIVTQRVGCARNPVHLASDFQVFQGVDVEELRHLKDVLVLSTKGEQSAASLLAGGDYDGDKVFVTWDARIVRNVRVRRVPELPFGFDDFFRRDSSTVDTLLEDGGESFMDFLFKKFIDAKSQLKIFSVYHLKIADEKGIDHEECVELGYVCRKLLEGEKSGYQLGASYLRDWREFVKKYKTPHWYARPRALPITVRKSTSAIGLLFDNLIKCEREFTKELSRNSNIGGYTGYLEFDIDISRRYNRIPESFINSFEEKVKDVVMSYDQEYCELKDSLYDDPGSLQQENPDFSDLIGRYRAKLFRMAKSLDDLHMICVIAYMQSHQYAVKYKQRLPWEICGDVLQVVKAMGVDERFSIESSLRPQPICIPRHFLSRMKIDPQTLPK